MIGIDKHKKSFEKDNTISDRKRRRIFVKNIQKSLNAVSTRCPFHFYEASVTKDVDIIKKLMEEISWGLQTQVIYDENINKGDCESRTPLGNFVLLNIDKSSHTLKINIK